MSGSSCHIQTYLIMDSVFYFYLLLVRICICQKVTVYSDADSYGVSQDLDVSQCTSSLQPDLVNAISSVNTHGHCAHFYKERECKGPYIIIKGGTPMNRIHGGFNDIIKSLGPCHDKCHEEYKEGYTKEVTVSIYDHRGYSGAKADLTVSPSTCVTVPKRLQYTVSSLKIRPSTICIEIFENWDCSGESRELRPGYRYIDNLNFWLHDDRTRSLGFCGINCQDRGNLRFLTSGDDPDPKNDTEIPYVTIYSAPGFHGPRKHVYFDETCVNIDGEWTGEALSIEIYGRCVIIYEDFGCSRAGRNLQLQSSQHDLGTTDPSFYCRVRSIELCNPNPVNRRISPLNPEDTSNINNGQGSSNLVIPLVLGLSTGLLVLVLLGLAFWLRRRRSRKNNIRPVLLSDRDIEEFHQGIGESPPEQDGNASAYARPYDSSRYEIPREMLKMDTKKPLGSGAYAKVYRAQMITYPDSSVDKSILIVAVKYVSAKAGDEYLRALLKEIKTMTFVGEHPHIVQLIGCCTNNIKEELLVVTELCVNGSMDKFLQANRTSFVNLVVKGQISISQVKGDLSPNYLNVDTPSISYFNTFHLLDWSYQIADGMAFLGLKKVIHGDLASRNVLLDSRFNAKIGDFGLSKQLYDYTKYVKRQQDPVVQLNESKNSVPDLTFEHFLKVALPWKWLALEVLENMEFSTQSDVWAYGITLYELFSIGGSPYPGSVFGPDFLSSLRDGLRNSKPSNALSDCYNLMMDCWREDPKERITFSELKEKFSEILQSVKTIRNEFHESIANNKGVSSLVVVIKGEQR